MPELKEAIARLRELLEECKRREPYDRAESVRLHQVFAVFNAMALEAMPQLLDAAEEVEKLRADKERLDWLECSAEGCPYPLTLDCWDSHPQYEIKDGPKTIGEGHSMREAIDAARSLQTHGRVPESTAEAKQEADPRKEKADA